MRKILMATVVLPLALGQAGVALAQSAQDSQRNANSSQATSELFYMIQQLQGEVRRLQGEVEEQRHLINRLQQQGRDRYIDLDQRILDLSEKVASQPAPEASEGGGSAASGQARETREYRQPEGDLTVNAYYWLGEVYLVKPQLEQAKQAFTIVATRFADHRKAPDAVYKLGVTHDRLGEKEQARRSMQTVIDDYPSSSAADLARKFLESQNG